MSVAALPSLRTPGGGTPRAPREPRSEPAPPVALSRPRPPGGGSGGGGAARRFRRGRGHGGAAAARAGGGTGGGQVPAPATGTAAALRPGEVPVGCRRVSRRCPWVSRVPDAHSRCRAPYRGHRLTPADDEMYQRTRVMVLEPESPNIMFIEGYSTRGFTISGDLVVGPCAVLPRSILQWNVSARRRGRDCRANRAPGAAPLNRRRVPAGWLPPRHLARESVAVPAAGAPDRYAGQEGRGLPPFGLLSGWLCGSHWRLQEGQVWAEAARMLPCPPLSCLGCRDPGAGHGGQGGAAAPCHDEADAGVWNCCGGAGHGKGEHRQHPIEREGGGLEPCGEGPSLPSPF